MEQRMAEWLVVSFADGMGKAKERRDSRDGPRAEPEAQGSSGISRRLGLWKWTSAAEATIFTGSLRHDWSRALPGLAEDRQKKSGNRLPFQNQFNR
jgi:hypothetical protein